MIDKDFERRGIREDAHGLRLRPGIAYRAACAAHGAERQDDLVIAPFYHSGSAYDKPSGAKNSQFHVENMRVFRRNRLFAQQLQILHRIAVQSAAALRQLARHGQAVLPAARDGRGIAAGRVRHAHPAELDAPRAVEKALRRVEVEAAVKLDERAERARAAEIARKREKSAGIGVLKALFLMRHALRRAAEEPLPVELEQVGAFPHIAERRGRPDGVDVRPAAFVRAFKYQNLAPVVQRPRPLHHVVSSVLRPDFRVADMAGQPGRIVAVFHQQLVCLGGQSVAADR